MLLCWLMYCCCCLACHSNFTLYRGNPCSSDTFFASSETASACKRMYITTVHEEESKHAWYLHQAWACEVCLNFCRVWCVCCFWSVCCCELRSLGAQPSVVENLYSSVAYCLLSPPHSKSLLYTQSKVGRGKMCQVLESEVIWWITQQWKRR